MKALILNSGTGSRMGEITRWHPKCMTMLSEQESIVSRQLRQLYEQGVQDIVITTGPFEEILKAHCEETISRLKANSQVGQIPLHITFIHNPEYKSTNYIYSIYNARKYLDDDLILLHGDLVFEDSVLTQAVGHSESCMIVSSTARLPEKDFKAVISKDKEPRIFKVGVEFFENALTAQPLYKLLKKDWESWLKEIAAFCEAGNRKCYAENALNHLTEIGAVILHPLDIENKLCGEIDTPEDLIRVNEALNNLEELPASHSQASTNKSQRESRGVHL